MGKRVQLRAWSCGHLHDGTTLRLSGQVTNHPQKKDGTEVITSPVLRTSGRLCFAASGNIYELVGEPEPDYLEFLRRIGKTYDPAQPVKVGAGG